MYRTIQVSSCVLIQGEFVEDLGDGRVVICDGKTKYRGRPIATPAPHVAAAAMPRAFEPVGQTA